MEKRTVCVLFGGAEGERIAINFFRALKEAGFLIVKDSSKADIIIAHSAGCYMLPETVRARKIILINIPHWPGKSIFRGLLQKTKHDLQFSLSNRYRRWFVYKTIWNTWYFLRIDTALKMFRGRIRGRLWEDMSAEKIIVRNTEDAFCGPDLSTLPFKHDVTHVALSGQHDDLWINPKPYIDLL
jgi:hypothetical protein